MRYLKNKKYRYKHIIVVPIISILIIPLVILDLYIELYHRTCFPLCRIPYVKRQNHIKIDRHRLSYLTFWQKIYCAYCGYGNGIISYWREIIAKTEMYWCGIKHEKTCDFIEPDHHKKFNFAEYDDKQDFKQKYKN
ncbi:MAG: hypothetical protein KAS07_05215 [Candidatus Pacebacteria bacterium]|nr:hypothetical protein [Candidatus Paceibacterota bacterium]